MEQKGKNGNSQAIEMAILDALEQEPENEHELSFFKSLIPTVGQLDPIHTMLFRAEVQHIAVKYLRQQHTSGFSTSASHLQQDSMGDQYEQYYTYATPELARRL